MEGAGGGEDEATLLSIGTVTAVPAAAMALGSAAISLGEPSEKLQARLQHFSAGLLIGAIITDIFPILRKHVLDTGTTGHKIVQWPDLSAACLGFSLALLLMYGIKNLSPEESGDGEADEEVTKNGEEDLMFQRPSESSVVSTHKLSDSTEPLLQPGSTDPLLQPGPEKNRFSMALARLDARTTALSLLVEEEQVDRDAVDEEVHGIDFLIDAARRSCRGASPIDLRNAKRLREHAAELAEDITHVRGLDTGNLPAIDKQLQVIAATLRHIHSHVDRGVFRRWRPQPLLEDIKRADSVVKAPPAGKVPWELVLAVVVDSIIDGMLIGLAGSVALTSGMLMSMATTIEMGFLGYSFACSIIKTARRSKAAAILGCPPLAMLAASMLAFSGASQVEGWPMFAGLIAFALAALLFLVVEELLLEAHEKEGSEVWHISGWLYVGLLLSIFLDMVV